MVKIVKASLPKQIADDIEMQIKKGIYAVGDKLPTEPELVNKYGVSRNTLREAVQSLTNSGLLEARQGDGTYVIAKERLQVEFFNAMSSSSINDVLDVRNMLENSIVVLAATNANEADLKEIKHYLDIRNSTKTSIRESTGADIDFHKSIAKATHNKLIAAMYGYVSQYFNEAIYNKIYTNIEKQTYIDDIHNLLYDAICEKNIDKAKDCIRKIIEI